MSGGWPLPVEAAGPWSTKLPGDSGLVGYVDDDVYHERLLLWPAGGSHWVVCTPDGDLYAEDLGCADPASGPNRFVDCRPDRRPIGGRRRRAYRFAAWPDDDRLRALIREARGIGRAEAARRGVALAEPREVRRASRDVIPLDAFFGLEGEGRRDEMRAARAALAPRAAALTRFEGRPPDTVDEGRPEDGATDRDGLWVVARPVSGHRGEPSLRLGDLVDVGAGDLLGDRFGVHFLPDGSEVVVEKVGADRVETYVPYVERLFGLSGAAPPVAEGEGGLKALRARLDGGAGAESEEMRVLPARFDEHGERFRPWKEVAAAQVEDQFDDGWPVMGPRTTLWIVRMFAKAGLTPKQWVERFLSTAKWSDTDRSAHELRTLAQYFETAGSYDQLNLASLGVFEHISRRWQVILQAHADSPTQPDYDAAAYITGSHLEFEGVAPEMRAYVAREMKDAAEVRKQLTKARELRVEGKTAAKAKAKPHPGARADPP